MMGGSQRKQPTKYELLSNSIIHLLHSDQFVLINPHKGTVFETKAPEEQWEYPRPPRVHIATAQVLPFPAHCGPLLPRRFQSMSKRWTDPNKRGSPERRGEKKFPHFRVRMKYLPKNTMRRLPLYSGHSINQL